jgi:hypothetical protein
MEGIVGKNRIENRFAEIISASGRRFEECRRLAGSEPASRNQNPAGKMPALPGKGCGFCRMAANSAEIARAGQC